MKIKVIGFNFIYSPNSKHHIIPENWPNQSPKIKVHGKFMGCIRSILGTDVKLKDNYRQWYVDKKSLCFWAESQGASKGFDLKQLEKVLVSLKKPIDDVKIHIEPTPKKPIDDFKVQADPAEAFFLDAESLNKWKKAISEQEEIKALKRVVIDLEQKPNKTKTEKEQLHKALEGLHCFYWQKCTQMISSGKIDKDEYDKNSRKSQKYFDKLVIMQKAAKKADLDQKIAECEKKAKEGDVNAQLGLAKIYHENNNDGDNGQKACEWYKIAAANGSEEAKKELLLHEELVKIFGYGLKW